VNVPDTKKGGKMKKLLNLLDRAKTTKERILLLVSAVNEKDAPVVEKYLESVVLGDRAGLNFSTYNEGI
jgi:hypothetical protein